MKLKCPEEDAQSMVEFLPPPEIRTGFYKVSIAAYQQPVNQKRQKSISGRHGSRRAQNGIPGGIRNSSEYWYSHPLSSTGLKRSLPAA
ncbi:MAG: hypothetical protein LBC51_08725 [Treponema sp.]|nr:hypothetical protein [Treponema sp.]